MDEESQISITRDTKKILDGLHRSPGLRALLPMPGMLVCPFVIGESYSRKLIYELLDVPEGKQRGNWETGYNRWKDDLFIFATVGSPATGGYDYQNRWDGDVFVWYAKEGTTLEQPLIMWMLNPPGRVYIFTRPAVRHDFKFEGIGTPLSHEDVSPVMIRWKIDQPSVTESAPVVLPTEEPSAKEHFEGTTCRVTVNAYERSESARQACLDHYGYLCRVCEFDFVATYGELGREFIHVHHLMELSSIGHEYKIDPVKDLLPVCPNCHSMLHQQKPALKIEELRAIVQSRRGAGSSLMTN